MLHLFRKIRRNGIENGKMKEYLVYAVGEIILVVVGILIALQINNWNEENKNSAFEQEILKQILFNLEKDKNELEIILGNRQKAVVAIDKVIALRPSEYDHDSVKYWLADIIQFDRFQPLTNAYEVLKSRGLHLLHDEDLRFELGTYYDDKAKSVIENIGDVEEVFKEYWIPIAHEEIKSFHWQEMAIPYDQETFLANRLYHNIIKLSKDNHLATAYRISVVLEINYSLQSRINGQIHHLD